MANKITIRVCPLCGETQIKRAITCVDRTVSSELFYLCRCEKCGFLFTQDFPAEAEIGAYYNASSYISHSDTHKGLVNKLYHGVRSFMLQRKAHIVECESHRKSGRLLDIGTGTGYFADTMHRQGWTVEAVEKSASARAFAQEHFSLEVKPEEALTEFAPESFDVITLWHVLEHIEPLNKTFEVLNHLLADNGVLIVAVPNHGSFDAKKYGAYWAAYDVPRHLWHFTPDTIQRFGNKHGFAMTARRPMPFDAFYVSILSERNMKHSFAFVRGMATGLAAWLASLAKKERSSSMIYVFRKKKTPNKQMSFIV